MKLLMKQPESGSEIQINYVNKLYNFLISMSPPDSLIKWTLHLLIKLNAFFLIT